MTPPPRRARFAAALVIGLCAAWLTSANIAADRYEHDYWVWWTAARALLAGADPYAAPAPGWPVFAYPLPAAVVAAPLAWVDEWRGAAIFTGLGFAVAAYALSASGWWRLLVLASAPALWVTTNAQWPPLLIGAALIPGAGFLLAVKPTIGAALFAYRPRWSTLYGGAALVALCFALRPDWLAGWLGTFARNTTASQYVPPVTLPGGVLLLAVLARWRRPEARLVAVLACVPQNFFFYDQLALMLVPRGVRSLAASVAWSHLVLLASSVALPDPLPAGWDHPAMRSAHLAPFVLWGLYVPALVMVLRRPNEGSEPLGLRTRIGLAYLNLRSWLGSPRA